MVERSGRKIARNGADLMEPGRCACRWGAKARTAGLTTMNACHAPSSVRKNRRRVGRLLVKTTSNDNRRGGRVVDCASLENWRAERFRGFESHPLRHLLGLQQFLCLESASWLFWCMWIRLMSHCLALDGTRLSEICQDFQKKLPRMRMNLNPLGPPSLHPEVGAICRG